MQADNWIQFLLRFLPAIVLIGSGFYAATDKKIYAQWCNLLYQLGSIRPDQREDPKIGDSVKWPFFVVALLTLWLPFSFYRLATRRFEIKSDIYSKPATIYDKQPANAISNSASNDATTNTATNSAVSPGASTPAHVTTPRGNNIYGQPR